MITINNHTFHHLEEDNIYKIYRDDTLLFTSTESPIYKEIKDYLLIYSSSLLSRVAAISLENPLDIKIGNPIIPYLKNKDLDLYFIQFKDFLLVNNKAGIQAPFRGQYVIRNKGPLFVIYNKEDLLLYLLDDIAILRESSFNSLEELEKAAEWYLAPPPRVTIYKKDNYSFYIDLEEGCISFKEITPNNETIILKYKRENSIDSEDITSAMFKLCKDFEYTTDLNQILKVLSHIEYEFSLT